MSGVYDAPSASASRVRTQHQEGYKKGHQDADEHEDHNRRTLP